MRADGDAAVRGDVFADGRGDTLPGALAEALPGDVAGTGLAPGAGWTYSSSCRGSAIVTGTPKSYSSAAETTFDDRAWP